jgi:glutamate carboxypeptidase
MTLKEKAFSYIDQHHEDMLNLWENMVNIDSGIGVKTGGMNMGNLCAGILESLGFSIRRVQYEKCGDTIIAEQGDMSNPFILLMGHMDTVFLGGETAKRPFMIKEGKAFGPGVLDMKGGIVILLSALRALKAADVHNKFGIKVILDADEETAHIFSNAPELIVQEAKGAKCAFNFETGFSDASLVVQRKGCWRFFVEVFGRGCHVGNDPENGRNAILEMAHKIIKIEALTSFQECYNFNVGTITGGTVANAAPDYCKIEVDVRYLQDTELPRLRAAVKNICDHTYVDGTRTVLSDGPTFGVMKRLPATMELLEKVKVIAEENGFAIPKQRICGGGSDAAYSVAAGVPTLCAMGVQGARNHTPEEWADVESLFTRSKMLITLLLEFSQGK